MSENIRILISFLVWRTGLFIIAFLSIYLLPQFGNRFPYWDTTLVTTNLPSWIWGFGNFDGVHYLRLVIYGYEGSQFSQAFFPLYPLLIKLLSFNNHYFITASVISNVSFLIGIFIYYKLLRFDFNEKIAFKSVLLLLAFPTAFYFASVYGESLFFTLTVVCFFFLRKKKFMEAGFFAALASATRILGLIFIPIFIVEIYLSFKKEKFKINNEQFIKSLISVIFIPLGTIIYMWYLKIAFNNPLYFLTSQPAFGAERSSIPIVMLPQVIFRYIKILFSVPINSWHFFSSALELSFTIAAIALLVISFKKIKIIYWLFAFGCLIIPTFTGTLSSMPRYILMIFLLLPILVENIKRYFILLLILFIILEMLLTSLFIRGYWVA